MKKVLLCFSFFILFGMLSACSKSSPVDTSLYPEVFSLLPNDFDQLLLINVDEDLLELLGTQYGATDPIIQEFSNIDAIVLRQSANTTEGESLLFVEGANVDINQLAALGLVALDQTYTTKQLTDTIQVHGQTGVISSKDFSGVIPSSLMKEYFKLENSVDGNFGFISRPNIQGLAGLAVQFSSKLDGTIGSLRLGNKLPSGEAKMLFDSGVVPLAGDDWITETPHPEVPVHISLHGLSDILGINRTMVKTFLPLIANQYLGDGVSLLTDTNIDTLLNAIGGTLSLDIVPNMLGMGRRLKASNPEVFEVFDNLYPILDGTVKTSMFSGAAITSIKGANTLSWNTSVPVGSGSDISLPLISIDKGIDDTLLSFMFIDDLPRSSSSITYPGSTIAVAQVDFELLTSMMGVESGSLLENADDTSLELEVIGVPSENIIRVLLK